MSNLENNKTNNNKLIQYFGIKDTINYNYTISSFLHQTDGYTHELKKLITKKLSINWSIYRSLKKIMLYYIYF